jgi:hypothetical protein
VPLFYARSQPFRADARAKAFICAPGANQLKMGTKRPGHRAGGAHSTFARPCDWQPDAALSMHGVDRLRA